MRILVTNDDSISAQVLPTLVAWAQKMGEVTVVVPKYQQSGKSHGIELHEPFEVVQVESIHGAETYTVDSTPADCVRFALMGMNKQFDLVISGINKGYNMGKDIMYSGTAAAVFEAGAQGIPAVAFSSSFTGSEAAAEYLDEVWAYMQENRLWEMGSLYNVNIPPEGGKILITGQGGPYYSDDFKPVGENRYQAHGICIHENKNDLTIDTDAVVNGYITISPLTVCRVDLALYEKLKELNQ
jgi:5'-nucleotidase